MKIFLTVLLTLFLAGGPARAQHVNIGIKAGLNLYNIHNNSGLAYDTRAAFHAGLIGHIHLSRRIALQPELLYSAQGAKYTVGNATTTIKTGYINIPLLLQYMFDNGFRLQAGPQVGFLVNAKSETSGNNTDIKNNLNAVDFSVAFGIGYINPASGIGIDARYNLGLSNINDNSTAESFNRGFQLGLFYLLKHK